MVVWLCKKQNTQLIKRYNYEELRIKKKTYERQKLTFLYELMTVAGKNIFTMCCLS